MLPQSYGDWGAEERIPIDWREIDKTFFAAVYHVDQAKMGTPLVNYRSAEQLFRFWKVPRVAREAYAHAAAWTALVSRLLQSQELASAAEDFLDDASGFLVRIRRKTDEIPGIMADAISTIQAGAGPQATRPDIRAIISTLTRYSDPASILETLKIEAEKTPIAQIEHFTEGVAEDVSSGAGVVLPGIRKLLGLSPKGPKAPGAGWPWQWKVGLGLGGAVVVAVVFRPYLNALMMIGGATRKSKWQQKQAADPLRKNRRNRATRSNRR